MDGNCTAIVRAIMIATGHTKVEVTDDDLRQAQEWELIAPKKTGSGEGMKFEIVPRLRQTTKP